MPALPLDFFLPLVGGALPIIVPPTATPFTCCSNVPGSCCMLGGSIAGVIADLIVSAVCKPLQRGGIAGICSKKHLSWSCLPCHLLHQRAFLRRSHLAPPWLFMGYWPIYLALAKCATLDSTNVTCNSRAKKKVDPETVISEQHGLSVFNRNFNPSNFLLCPISSICEQHKIEMAVLYTYILMGPDGISSMRYACVMLCSWAAHI